jgi:hypothetical protein
MNIQIPPVAAVKASLLALSHAQVLELSRTSRVPFTTIWKIRAGTTENPGMDTVGKFWPHIEGVKQAEETAKAA